MTASDLPPAESALGSLLESAVPRYTSYPTLASFHEDVSGTHYDAWIAALPLSARLSVYVHVPFCERLCWYCACRTQAVNGPGPVEAYMEGLVAEIKRAGARLPRGATVARIAWGGGSPTALSPAQIAALARALAQHLPLAADAELSVEVDPIATDAARIGALVAAGMTSAVIGVQDFAPEVQRAIGRRQSREETLAAAEALRRAGVRVAVDQLYGLPMQTEDSLVAASRLVTELAPERIALVGYAHVPSLAKRQCMIDEATLPRVRARLAQYRAAAAAFVAAGYRPVGIDHFARPGGALDVAAAEGRLRRDFQGYFAEAGDALLGFGASAISRFPQGFVQNSVRTRSYLAAVAAGDAAAARGVALSLEDKVRGRAIEMLMCRFALDRAALAAEFGDFVGLLDDGCARALARFPGQVAWEDGALRIVREAPVLARLVACLFDVRTPDHRQHALAI